jgi:hypothetical protein
MADLLYLCKKFKIINMKRIIASLLFFLAFFSFQTSTAQTLSESAMKKVTVGLDIFNDIWFNTPQDVTIRKVNASVNAYLTYNFAVGNSKKFTVGLGLGVGNHNMYSNDGFIQNVNADTIQYIPAQADIKMKRSRLGVTYLEVPLELRFKSKGGFKVGVGFKLGYLIDSKEKYVGSTSVNGPLQVVKFKKLSQLNTFSYSPTVRIGYKSFNVFFSYGLGTIFRVGHGPQMHPMSLGITLTPF